MNPDVRWLLNKLAPLMPDEVSRWRRMLDYADSELATLLNQQIVQTAYRRLGDFRNKLLLSLPAESKARGAIQLGNIVYEHERWPLGISQGELLQNVAIFGRSGAGKTNVAFHLLRQLVRKRIPVLFLDWKRTARHLLPRLDKTAVYTPGRSLSPLRFNPFVPPPGMEKHIYINHVIDMLADAYTLGDGAKSLLQEALTTCYAKKESWPSVQDVLQTLKDKHLTGRAKGWQVSAVRALQSLEFAKLGSSEDVNQADLVSTFLKSSTIIELDALNQGAKKFLIPLLCLWIYSVQLGTKRREQLQLVVLVEEAHHVLYRHEQRAKESVMNMLFRQCREIGIGMVVIDQHPHLISSAALGNTYISICLNQKEPVDVTRAAQLSLVPDSDKRWFSMLPVGQGVVKLQDRWNQPILVKFPLVDVQKGLITDELLSQILDGKVARSDLKRVHRRATRNRQHQENGDGRLLSEDEFVFLHDILTHRDDGVRARYQRLGWSGERGHAVKERLVARGWLSENTVKVGRSRKQSLTVPKIAETTLGLSRHPDMSESIVHEYWKRFYATLYQEKGCAVDIEAPRHDGFVDVLAINGQDTIGIEIETGKSDFASNVRKGFISGFNKVIVVATDEFALNKIERQLVRENLLIPGKVKLVLRDGLKEKKQPRRAPSSSNRRGGIVNNDEKKNVA